ncbi:hypothetical protein MIND_00732500 [Mycena indigotica]|uniref:Pentatricopeptide repeat-containing protein n=1 Tax=Mycena indigotica TaxID=2126181 RepID=A0A8H6SKZ8_9AGAR|nr:uncharacterized protein MIND_00732500 [Mycena indigotica]KAF7301670.1 hypothetical protein MIND_00732500 [Mycena indigotica]
MLFLRRQYATSFRSRHYVPKKTNEKPKTLHPLEPHVLSGRLKKLADKNQLDVAVSMLKNAPLAAQNTPVWNTLIWECSKARRFKLAYELFTDMKRRGFSATTRTFQTMFTGLSHIEDWSTHQQQLKNARSLYSAYQRHAEDLKKRDPRNAELEIDPLPAYATILGNAEQFDELFALYYVITKNGPPTKFLMTAIFRALSSDKASPEQSQKNAEDARVLWREMLKFPKLDVDGALVTSAVLALSKGQLAEEKLAFQLLREHFGLSLSGEPRASSKLALTPPSLAAALSLCFNREKPQEAIHFFHQVLKRPGVDGGADIIDRGHMEIVFKAIQSTGSARLALETLDWMSTQRSSRNGVRLEPTRWIYILVLLTCQKAADWTIATRVFNMMTGYHCHDFMDGAVSSAPRQSRRPDAFGPDPETMSAMLRVARSTENGANMRQCLRLVNYLDSVGEGLFIRKSRNLPESTRTLKKWAFDVVKMSEAVVETVDWVNANSRSTSDVETTRWSHLRRVSLGILSQKSQSREGDGDWRVRKLSRSDRRLALRPSTREKTRPLTSYEKGFGS